MSQQPEPRPITQEETDAARRMAESVNLHVAAMAAEGTGRDEPPFVAINLADGRARANNTLYDNRRAACARHRFEPGTFYVRVGRERMPDSEALIVLQMARMAFKRGVVFSEEEVVVPQLPELMIPFIPRTLRGLLDGLNAQG
jgi:hypothetical protein